jgi:hypothetical protein
MYITFTIFRVNVAKEEYIPMYIGYMMRVKVGCSA